MMNRTMKAVAIVAALLLFSTMESAAAKGGDDDKKRTEVYGRIQAMPQNGLQGEWLIGGREFRTDPGTEFDQTEGELEVGGCAKVDVRDGRVHEIDSEPLHECP